MGAEPPPWLRSAESFRKEQERYVFRPGQDYLKRRRAKAVVLLAGGLRERHYLREFWEGRSSDVYPKYGSCPRESDLIEYVVADDELEWAMYKALRLHVYRCLSCGSRAIDLYSERIDAWSNTLGRDSTAVITELFEEWISSHE